MLDPETILRLRDDVRFRLLGDEAVIVCQDSGEILAVNEIGAQVLSAIDGGTSVKAIIAGLETQYDVSPESLKEDIMAFIGELLDANVVQP